MPIRRYTSPPAGPSRAPSIVPPFPELLIQMTIRTLRPLLLAAALCACALALPGRAAAQTDTVAVASDTLYTVRLTDGSVIHGRIVEESDERVTVETQAGVRVQLERGQIDRITRLRGRVVGGSVWPTDPNRTRLFFGPTARAVGQGEGYLGVYEVVFPFLTYGITSNLSISAGTPIVPGAIGEFWYFAPKLTVYETERTAAAVGVLGAAVEGETAGIVYGAGTFGDSDQALTAGVGWGFSNGDLNNQALVMVGGEMRTGRNTKFISENYLLPGANADEGAIVSGGLRFFGERLSADLGVGFLLGDCEGGCWLPLVNFVYSF
jgi:hypothetical protein